MKKIALDGDADVWTNEFEHQLQLALYVAYLEARKGGKRSTHDEQIFELNADENLKLLRHDILDKTYRPSRSTAHIIYNPVIREIFAATFRDRVVHHLIFDTVYDWWDKRMIEDAYSCRVGKGTLYGIRRLDYHIRAASHNYARKVYVTKLDIQGYFMSLPRKELYQRAMWGLDKQFAQRTNSREYDVMKFLWHKTIFDDPIHGVRKKGDLEGWDKLPASKSLFGQPAGKGIVIGNLTSQLLSNIYLDQLDRFVMYGLGYKHYGRYVDDFYIVVSGEQLARIKKDLKAIEEFLRLKQLTLHPKKRMMRKIEQGVPFLGAVVYPNHIVPGKRITRNTRIACEEVMEGVRGEESIVSYLGHAKYFNSVRMLKRNFYRVGWEYNV